MGSIQVRVSARDLRRIQAEFERLPEQIRRGAQDAVEESGEAVRDEVSRTVRKDTGRLSERVRVRHVGAMGLTADVGWFDGDTYYAQYQEFGTSSIAADPVLTRAAEYERRRFPRRLKDHIEENL